MAVFDWLRASVARIWMRYFPPFAHVGHVGFGPTSLDSIFHDLVTPALGSVKGDCFTEKKISDPATVLHDEPVHEKSSDFVLVFRSSAMRTFTVLRPLPLSCAVPAMELNDEFCELLAAGALKASSGG